MTYFNTSFLKFFKELSKNNNKAWFDENRKTYEKEVKKPFSDFVEEMIKRIQEHEPEVKIKASEAIMRINKDIRFSKDKTPYNTHVSANISVYGKKDKSYPGFYFQLSPEGIMIYGGAYMVDSTTLEAIRNHISANLTEFSSVNNDKSFKEKYGKLQGEQNKRIPKEFQEIAEKEPLIANKQFFYSAELKPELITSEQLLDELMKYYLAGKKMNDFLKKAFKK
ncbi:MAG: DUF2461 domain-containing protein [Bacteroidia bacterium]